MPVTAIIAEDEPILRAQLKSKLGKLWPELQIVADVGDGELALEAIEEHRPQLAFLDIQMPEMTGVEVARSLAANRELKCHIVFVTAFDQYAVEAFEANAVDYVLKPYSDARLQAAVDRLRSAWAASRAGAQGPGRWWPPSPGSIRKTKLRWIKASVGATLRLFDRRCCSSSPAKVHDGCDQGTRRADRTPIKKSSTVSTATSSGRFIAPPSSTPAQSNRYRGTFAARRASRSRGARRTWPSPAVLAPVQADVSRARRRRTQLTGLASLSLSQPLITRYNAHSHATAQSGQAMMMPMTVMNRMVPIAPPRSTRTSGSPRKVRFHPGAFGVVPLDVGDDHADQPGNADENPTA
jgi:CheY-like chemotaxis protein